MIHVIGGGLAGTEAAWQAASRGEAVTLHEMRPARTTAVHRTDRLAELVCSNSLRGDKLDNAVGLLKQEMRRAGSLVMRAADAARVPAGAALAVDRDRFAGLVTEAIQSHPSIAIAREEILRLADLADGRTPVIVATGPLTSDALAADIARLVGRDHLSFYDAISPIVLAGTIDMSRVFRASRWGRSLGPPPALGDQSPADGGSSVAAARAGGDEVPRADNDAGDYLNCPFTEAEYRRFYEALVGAELSIVHDFDRTKFFEGCLPIEVMARRGPDTLRFGPMKPVGLVDPRTGRQPYAVVQLRQDNLAGDHYSLVGFQTQVTWGDQARLLRLVPGLERAEFVRLGTVHRNTYINAPRVLADTWQVRGRHDLFFAGQISGVEGYVESAAAGLMAGRHAAAVARGARPIAPPRSTALGALAHYVSHAEPRDYQPTNITFGIMDPPPAEARGRHRRALAVAERALGALEAWIASDPAGPRGRDEEAAVTRPMGRSDLAGPLNGAAT